MIRLKDILEAILTDLNPTGDRGVFSDYSADDRASATLGPNLTTLDKTTGGLPSDPIRIYRGVPSDVTTINPGDYITTNQQLAKDYAGSGKVLTKVVRKGDVVDDTEDPAGEEYLYIPDADKRIQN